MSLSQRIGSMSVASATVLGLALAMGVAPPAAAEPCTGAAAAVQPPPAAPVDVPEMPPSSGHPPTGHRPRGANDNAPLPKLGQLSVEMLKALTPQSGRVEKQAGVVTPPAPRQADQVAPAPQPVAAPQPPPAPEPTVPPAPPGTSIVGWVTGPESLSDTIGRFAVSGTDLGVMWDNGDPVNNQVLMAFGDTYGYCSIRGQQWRYNALFRSQDRSLAKTISVPNGAVGNKYSGSPSWAPGLSKQIINSIKWAPEETGIIPTAGISVGTTQYLNFMSIRSWDNSGQWTTNFSGIGVSHDNGEHWDIYPASIRAAAPDRVDKVGFVPGNENFQQAAYLRPGDGYVYSFGTPAGRSGAGFVSRVNQGLVPDIRRYEYWNVPENRWIPGDPGAATPVIPGPMGELSVQYNTYLKQYLMVYCNGLNDVVIRTAPAPQGPWGPEQLLVSSMEIPGGIYAPYLHPWSKGRELYYNLSLWSAYNVMLMKTVLP